MNDILWAIVWGSTIIGLVHLCTIGVQIWAVYQTWQAFLIILSG